MTNPTNPQMPNDQSKKPGTGKPDQGQQAQKVQQKPGGDMAKDKDLDKSNDMNKTKPDQKSH